MPDLLTFDKLLAGVLPNNSLYAVGGRVRDEIRATGGAVAPTKDGDYLVVGMEIDELAAVLAKIGSVDRVGVSFSILKVTLDGVTVDVGVPRREYSTGSGHRAFTVESGAHVPLVDDLARRDFRMNMIARAIPSGAIVDPYNGCADIAAARIDILHEQTFVEDPLRMLRACQFAARFGYTISPRTHTAMQAAAELVRTVSPQRVFEEFQKLFLRASRPSQGIDAMRTTGLLAHIWPELLEGYGIEQNEWHAYDVWRHNLETLDAVNLPDLSLRIAALLHDVGKPRTKDGPHFYRHEYVGEAMAREMLARIAAPNDITERVAALVRNHMYVTDPVMTDAAIRRFVRRVGVDSLELLYALREADIIGSGLPRRGNNDVLFQERVSTELSRRPPLSIKDLAINGLMVMDALRAAGATIPAGGDRRVGRCLQYLLESVTDDPIANYEAGLVELLRSYIANNDLQSTEHIKKQSNGNTR